MMIIPSHIHTGDRIRIISPSGKINQDKLIPAINLLKNEGFEVLLSDHALGSHFQFSGTDEQRLADLQLAMDDEQCKAIICSRGGYGAIRFVDQLDFSSIKNNPKWLIGFSDITTLHCRFQQEGIASIHGAMPGFYLKDGKATESFDQLMKLIKGVKLSINTENQSLDKTGECSGQIVGGNLSILHSLMGTPYELDTNGKILFIEDLSEYLYHLDRMMQNFRLSGKLKNLAGLVVGQFTDMKDNDSPFGQSLEEIILHAVKDYDFPVCFNFPAGHVERNLPLALGANYQLKVNQQSNLILQ